MANKKRRSTSSGLTGAEKQEARQRRLEEKRLARAEAAERQRKQAQRERLVRFAFIGLIAVGAIWFFFLRTKAPTEIGGHELLSDSQAGEGVHTGDPVTYDTVPPVSGAHAPGSAPCGVHAEQIPNENLVHTLEHGAVGLLYDPTIDIQQVRDLENIVGGVSSHMFSAPYEGMDTPIVVSAWGYRMPLEEVDEPAIQEFMDEFRQNGPEDQDCPNTANTPFGGDEPEQDSLDVGDDASPSPGAGDATPGGGEGTPEPENS
jgi:Protein of unknown function (DUF3105)